MAADATNLIYASISSLAFCKFSTGNRERESAMLSFPGRYLTEDEVPSAQYEQMVYFWVHRLLLTVGGQ